MVKPKISKKSIDKKFKCSPCALSAAIGVYTNVCKKIGEKDKCNLIINRLADEKISLNKALTDIKKLARGHQKELKALKYVDKLLKEG